MVLGEKPLPIYTSIIIPPKLSLDNIDSKLIVSEKLILNPFTLNQKINLKKKVNSIFLTSPNLKVSKINNITLIGVYIIYFFIL